MLYLMIINRSHEVIKIMGHDVKQFKSLEGFLESGPQFILQSYILLRGEKQGYEDLTSVEASRFPDDLARGASLGENRLYPSG